MRSPLITDPIPGLDDLDPDLAVPHSHDLPITLAARRRFWNRVERTTSGCWIWMDAVSSEGYGRITWTHHRHSRTLSTHRFALHLAYRACLPAGLVAAHGCDHPLCVRVGENHVHLSTQHHNLLHAVNAGGHLLEQHC